MAGRKEDETVVQNAAEKSWLVLALPSRPTIGSRLAMRVHTETGLSRPLRWGRFPVLQISLFRDRSLMACTNPNTRSLRELRTAVAE